MHDKQLNDVDSSELSPIQTGLQYMYLHYKENPSAYEVSKVCGYSTEHFCRQFKSTTGNTYTHFLNLLKTNHSKIMLLTSNLSIILRSRKCADLLLFQTLTECSKTKSDFLRRNSKSKTKKGKQVRNNLFSYNKTKTVAFWQPFYVTNNYLYLRFLAASDFFLRLTLGFS